MLVVLLFLLLLFELFLFRCFGFLDLLFIFYVDLDEVSHEIHVGIVVGFVLLELLIQFLQLIF